jgi:DUF438 domain-containing protein
MRLLNPSPGEVIDRLTILELKVQASEKRGTDATQFLAEKASLEEYLSNWDQMLREDYASGGIWDTIAMKKTGLTAVNTLLWEAEDLVRETSDTEALKLAQLCRRIANLNDSRAKLVAEISALYGAKETVSEKIYAQKPSGLSPT